MAFHELELRRIENTVGAMCRRRSPAQHRNELEITYDIDNHNVSVYEVRPRWDKPSEKTKLGIARFKFVRTQRKWTLYWMRRDLKWHLYDADVMPTTLEALVKIVDEDSNGAFFG